MDIILFYSNNKYIGYSFHQKTCIMITNLKESECAILLANNYICRLSYIYHDRPFIVPMTYYFDKEKKIFIGYSADGHKTKAMRKNNKVSLQISEKNNDDNCVSVLAHGLYKECSGSEEKKYLHEFTTGVKQLILKKEDKNYYCISDFSNKVDNKNKSIVFTISIDEITGKTVTKDNV